MAVLAATGRVPWDQDENKSHDGGSGWVQATDAQKVEAIAGAMNLELEDLKDGRRMRQVNHVIQMVAYYERLAHARDTTSGLVRRQAVVAALWPGEADKDKLKRCGKSLRRWERLAEASGLLKVRDGRGERGLRWELLSGATLAPSRGYSSVGRAPGSHPGGQEFESP